jgi:hypothetical protein
MADADFPAAFLFQTLKVLRSYARRTQKLQMYANTTFNPGGQMQLEFPSAALIDLDSFCIMANLTSTLPNAADYVAFPPTVGAFIENITVQINGETFQSTQYAGELDVVLKDFSFGDAVKNRMGVSQLGKKMTYATGAAGLGPYSNGMSRYITLTASDLPGFFSSVQPRVLNTSLIGPLVLSLVLRGNDVMGIGSGAGTRVVCADAALAPATAALTLAQLVYTDAGATLPGENQYINHPGSEPTPRNVEPTYTWSNVEGLCDVLNMPPEFTQFNQMVLASGNSFQMPFQNYFVVQNALDMTNINNTYLNRTMRFSIATSSLNMIMSWFCPNQGLTNRYFDDVTKRSGRYNRRLPGSWQMTVSGTLYPSFPCTRKYSWPVFLASICKMHDAQHEFHGGLTNYPYWVDRFGVMVYRFKMPDQDGKSWYSGLNTQNVALQCFIQTNAPADATEGLDPPCAAGQSGTQYVAMQTTKVLSIGANKTTSCIQ